MNTAAQQLGRLGGLAKSKAKTDASRANGKLGGRPKTKQVGEMEMSRIKIIELLAQAQSDLENLPVGGIGEFGAEQWQLDEAAITGQPFDGDGNYHQGQQAWLRIQEVIDILKLKATR